MLVIFILKNRKNVQKMYLEPAGLSLKPAILYNLMAS